MNLRERIERDVRVGPVDTFDLDVTLRQGRRAVRRKRAMTGIAGTAAAVALATGLTVGMTGSGDPDPDPDTSVANQGAAARCPAAGRSTPECSTESALDDKNVTVTPSGELVVRDGWTITHQVDDPIPTVKTVAVAVTRGDDTEWALIKYPDANGDVFAEHTGPQDFPGVTFDHWLDYAVSRWTGEGTNALVKFTSSGKLVARSGWTIDQQATGLSMPPGYRGPAGVTAVMQLDLDRSSGWYLVRPTAAGAEAFPVLAANGGMVGSIDGVLEYVGSNYVASEQGFLRGYL